MQNTFNQNALLSQLIKGNQAAFAQLFSDMHAPLCFLANQILKSEDLSRDLVADIFLQIWETRTELVKVRNLRAFLYTSTRNRALDQLKKIKQVTTLDHPELQQVEQEAPGNDFLQSIYTAETIRSLYQAIDQLPPECKKVVELVLEGRSTSEIAARLSISASAVSNQKNRAVKLLRDSLPFNMLLLLLALAD